MRAHAAPKLYLRGGVWWCYWRNERWSTKQTEEAEARRVARERYDPRHTASRTKVIADAIALLYDALDRRCRTEATKRNARDKLGHFARMWAGLPLSAIDFARVNDYVRTRTEEGASRLTISHELGYLRQAWKLARASGWAARHWDELMPERFDRGYVPRTRWLTTAELGAVLRSLEPHRAAWVAWIVATGSDVGDIVRAERGDLDWKRKLVRVRGTKTVFRDRYVPITPLTAPLLRLAARHGPPFTPWPWANGVLRKLAVRLGIPHFSPKDLRRTHGQWLRGAGVAPHLIGRVLGHADSAMADRVYAQGEDEAIGALVRGALSESRTNAVRVRGAGGHQRAPTARGTRRK